MNSGFQLFDIILFAMIAAFLVLRLRSVLGRRTGNERPPRDLFGTRRKAEVSKVRSRSSPASTEPDVAWKNCNGSRIL